MVSCMVKALSAMTLRNIIPICPRHINKNIVNFGGAHQLHSVLVRKVGSGNTLHPAMPAVAQPVIWYGR